MSRRASPLLTDRESQLMDVLWKHGPSTAEQVRERLADDPHDSTVRTMLRVLATKGYVRVRGRQPVVYEAAVARSKVQASATRNLLKRFFGGSVEDLVLRLVEDEQLTPEQLERLRKSASNRRRRGDK
jgi:predicted transcriptional regulator